MANRQTKLFFLLICSIASQTGHAEENDYPAPPGFYGQEEALKNSKINLGQGAPYVVDPHPVENQADTNQAVQQEITPRQAMPRENPQPLILLQPQPVAGSTPAYVTTGTEKTYKQPTPEYLPPAPRPMKQAYSNYPDAKELDHHYQNASKLSFGQWGEGDLAAENIGTAETAPNRPSFDYPQMNQPYPYQQQQNSNSFFNSYPPLRQKTGPVSDYPKPGFNSFSNNMHRYQAYKPVTPNWPSDWTPPISTPLKNFDQFPVPQDLYGNTQFNDTPLYSNSRYFKQIPEQEIIYPPNYPGRH